MSDDHINNSTAKVIRTFFKETEMRIFKTRQLQQLIAENRTDWRVPALVQIEKILECAELAKIKLDFPGRAEVRYCKGDVSIYELALSLKPECYLSHHTALFVHALTDAEPKDVYVNAEQTEKPRWEQELEQERIDWAFQQRPRITNNTASYRSRTVYLLSGKHTANLGVGSKTLPDGRTGLATGIERTLVDAVVRPIYCGGIKTVLDAFRKAKGRVSTMLLAKLLSGLDHVYPYHQSIGFLLERAGGFTKSEIEPILRMPKECDFYLEHQMKSPAYSKRWRIYYPSALEKE